MQRAREGPPLVELVEGDVVDLHDDQIVGAVLRAPDREAGVDAALLQRSERDGRVADDPQSGGHGPDHQEAEPQPRAGQAGVASASAGQAARWTMTRHAIFLTAEHMQSN